LFCASDGICAIPIAYEHVSELLAERGVEVDPSCIWRWVQAYAPELRCRQHLKPTNKSYRTDETYIKVKGEDKYLYRAVDSTGPDHRLPAHSQTGRCGSQAFLPQGAELSRQSRAPGDQRGQEPGLSGAIEVLKAEGCLLRRVRLRQCKYLNNVIEQDHRTVKKRVWLAKGYGSFQSAWRTLQGIETVAMIRKRRVRWLAKGDAVGQAHFIAELFGIAA
jgi:transposase-like protein